MPNLLQGEPIKHYADMFSANVMMSVMQTESRFLSAGAVEIEQITPAKRAYFDRYGSKLRTPEQYTSRYADSPLGETVRDRRALDPVRWTDGEIIENYDVVRTLHDPTNPVARNMSAGFARKVDDVIITAFDAAALSGQTGGSTTPYDSNMTVAVNSWAYGQGTGNAGLTISKLTEAKIKLDEQEVPDTDRFFAVAAKQLGNLLATTEVTSADYNTVKALVNGQVDTFLGFKFIRTERLGLETTSQRKCFAFHKSAIKFGYNKMPETIIERRADKHFNPYVYMAMDIGAVRMEEARVSKVICLEA